MSPTDALALAVERKLDTRVRPLLQIHGGEVSLVSVDDGHVQVRFEGACVGCPLRPVTLSLTVDRELGAIEGVESVSATGVRVSPHAAERMRAAFADHLEARAGSPSRRGSSRRPLGQGAGNG